MQWCRQEGYIPPKKPYSFEAMLDDILDLAAVMLVENGRLSIWMPTANDEDIELAVPAHPSLEVVSICVQAFNKCEPMALEKLMVTTLMTNSHCRVSTTFNISASA